MRQALATAPCRALVLILAAVALGACGEKASPPAIPPQKPSVIDPQLRALEKARGVEQTLQDSAENQRRTIDDAGK
jgi:hypothetical protein